MRIGVEKVKREGSKFATFSSSHFLSSSLEGKGAVLHVGLRRGWVGMRAWGDRYLGECLEGGGVMMEVKVVSSVLVYRKGVKGWGGVGCSPFVR